MAIIKPSKTFTGSEVSNNDAGKYIKPDTKQVLFNKNSNKEGAWLYFLPAYKVDDHGNGVWYRALKVRDNFGDKFKDKYAVTDALDPVAHFERNFKLYYPEESKPVDTQTEKGTRKVYPNYGRIATRVIYNVAYVNTPEAGPHILDLPAFNGASLLTDWLRGKDKRGNDRPVLNDPEHCIPVFIKLKDDRSGTPWQIEPEQSDAAAIPNELADSDLIYNLDEVFIIKPREELIAKLRDMYKGEVFDQCMDGYPGFDNVVVQGRSPFAREEEAAPRPPIIRPAVKAAPSVGNIAKAKIAPAKVVVSNEDEEVIETETVDTDENPLAGISAESAKAFLSKK